MNDNKFKVLIQSTCDAAVKHRELVSELDEEYVKRYGYHPSEIDCCYIIDATQYGTAYISSVSEFKSHMLEAIAAQTDFNGDVEIN